MPRSQPAPRLYHHGNLAAGLIDAARQMLEEEGVASLKLRSITRAAGVSATAADPHFGNLTGLLSELAAVGYEELASSMSVDATPTPRQIGEGYIRFALGQPGMFTLMFRSDLLDMSRPRLAAAAGAAFGLLRQASDRPAADVAGTLAEAGQRAANWALVHGLAVLAIEGQLDAIQARVVPPCSLGELMAAAFER